MDWKQGEIVHCWTPVTESFFKGIVEFFDDRILKVRAFMNGKVYTFNVDGTAVDPNGLTSKRVFSVRELNKVILPED